MLYILLSVICVDDCSYKKILRRPSKGLYFQQFKKVIILLLWLVVLYDMGMCKVGDRFEI